MDNLLELLKLFSNNKQEPVVTISKELKEQYPYGEFPIRYTKTGQNSIREHSEKRFSYDTPPQTQKTDISIESILPLIQTLSSGKKSSSNMLDVLSKVLLKDNPQMAGLLKLFPKKNNHTEIKGKEIFPNTNKVETSSLKRIN